MELSECAQAEESFGWIKSRLYALTLRWRKKFIAFVANDVKSRNPRSVLDIGCGTCDVLRQLQGSGIELYGIDPSPFMLQLAKNRGSDYGLSAIHLGRGDCWHIPFDRKFDMILSSLSFHHWRNREECVPNILARLNDNGEFAIYEYHKESMSFLRRMIAGKHALSTDDVSGLRFNGYAEIIEYNGSVIVIRFKKTT